MKLRMLNGAHSLIAYMGLAAGHAFVRDVMANAALAALVRRHMRAAATTLDPVPGVDLAAYADSLVARFSNRAIAHRTDQIAMDGTQKLPQRLLEPAGEALAAGAHAETFALAVAAWMAHASGHGGAAPRDPRAAEIAGRLAGREGAAAVADALFGLPGLFPESLLQNRIWRTRVSERLGLLMRGEVAAAIAATR
jgi:fructuronate reductase